MGVFHYKARLLNQDEINLVYGFYPDYFEYEEVFGEFQINRESWRLEITRETQIEGKDDFFCNERPVRALAYKIKKHFEENKDFPTEIFYIA